MIAALFTGVMITGVIALIVTVAPCDRDRDLLLIAFFAFMFAVGFGLILNAEKEKELKTKKREAILMEYCLAFPQCKKEVEDGKEK